MWVPWGEVSADFWFSLPCCVPLPGGRPALVGAGRSRRRWDAPARLLPTCPLSRLPWPCRGCCGRGAGRLRDVPVSALLPSTKGSVLAGGGSARAPRPICSPTPGQEGLPALSCGSAGCRDPAPPWDAKARAGSLPQGAAGGGGGRGLGWSCPTAGWGSMPASARPHGCPARRGCLRWRWQRPPLSRLVWKAARAAGARGGGPLGSSGAMGCSPMLWDEKGGLKPPGAGTCPGGLCWLGTRIGVSGSPTGSRSMSQWDPRLGWGG